MTQKLNCILLVDDDEPTNFLHQLVIEESSCCEHVVAKNGGASALEYLKSAVKNGDPHPDMILLDINMPGMNGWEFLENYDQLIDEAKARVVVVMLTTSMNPADDNKARESGVIAKFLNKPLTEEMLKGLLKQHFPEYLDE